MTTVVYYPEYKLGLQFIPAKLLLSAWGSWTSIYSPPNQAMHATSQWLALALIPRIPTYLGNKDKSQDDSGTNEEPSAEESRIPIDKLSQGVGSDNNDCKHNASHIDCCCNILGIIKSLDLHLASCKGKNKGNDLQYHFVAIQDTQENTPGCGAADVCEVESDNFPFLGGEIGAGAENTSWRA